MTREELDFIGSMNMCDEISNEAYKKIVCHCRELEPCEDVISRQVVKEQMIKYGFHSPDMTVTEFVEDLPPVTPQPKTGHWIEEFNDLEGEVRFTCSSCGKYQQFGTDYCYNCGAKMVDPQETETN